jgi:hypothetical protein
MICTFRRFGERRGSVPSSVRDSNVDGGLGRNDHHLDTMPTSKDSGVVSTDLQEEYERQATRFISMSGRRTS